MWHQGFSIGESTFKIQSSYLELGEIWSNSLNRINRIGNEFIEIQQHHLKVFGTANGPFPKRKNKRLLQHFASTWFGSKNFQGIFHKQKLPCIASFLRSTHDQAWHSGSSDFLDEGASIAQSPNSKKKDLQSKITRFFDISGTWVWKGVTDVFLQKLLKPQCCFFVFESSYRLEKKQKTYLNGILYLLMLQRNPASKPPWDVINLVK